MPIVRATATNIKKAAAIIRAGGIVAFPTETVYGLGANAFDALAVKKIFAAKGRPQDNPLIVHIASKRDVGLVAQLRDPCLPAGRLPRLRRIQDDLMRRFWPGPLTLILPRNKNIPPVVSAGLGTVAVRMPDHAVARALIRAAGVPIAAPSANKSGRPSPTTAEHVRNDFGEDLFILDGGKTRIGLESTVVDMTVTPPAVLRHGGVSIEALRKVIPDMVDGVEYKNSGVVHPHTYSGAGKISRSGNNSAIGVGAKSPGMKYRHYAPNAKVILTDNAVNASAKLRGKRIGILGTRENAAQYAPLAQRGIIVRILGSRENLAGCARRLFSELRAFDKLKVDVILVERFPKVGIGRALMERLERAAE